MTDLSLLSLLAAFFGVLMGWNAYAAIYIGIARRKKRAPFGAREGIISGALLLAVAGAIADVSYLGVLAPPYRVANYFIAALFAGGAFHQLWLCWRGMRLRP